MKLLKKEKKKIIFDILKAHLKPLGFKWILTGGAPEFYLKEESRILKFHLSFLDSGLVGCSNLGIQFNSVENIMAELSPPPISQKGWDEYKKGIYIMDTIYDKQSKIIPNSFDYDLFETAEQIENFGKKIIEYLDVAGFPFAERYQELPAILKEMDRLQAEGEGWNQLLASAQAEFFMKGLIISRLCNDENLAEKIKYVDSIYYDTQYGLEDYFPSYEKLKEMLPTIEPIYNV